MPGFGRNNQYTNYQHTRRGAEVCLLDQAVTDGKGSCGCPVVAIRFVEDVREMCSDRFLTEYQLLSYLRVG